MQMRYAFGFQSVLALAIAILTLIAVAPLPADVSVRGELTHEFEMEPGSTHAGTIVLENTGGRAAEVKLYQTDYRSEVPGQNFYETPGTNERSNAAWISVSPLRFTVPAGESYTISYVITVPEAQPLDGSYWSVLMIEPIPPESPESSGADPETTSVGILTVIRYGFKFITHIGSTGTVNPQVEDASLFLVGDVPTLGIDVRNDGTRHLTLEVWAELYDSDGRLLTRRDGIGGGLYPGSSRRFQIPLQDVGASEFTALVIMDAGDNNVFGISLPLAIQ